MAVEAGEREKGKRKMGIECRREGGHRPHGYGIHLYVHCGSGCVCVESHSGAPWSSSRRSGVRDTESAEGGRWREIRSGQPPPSQYLSIILSNFIHMRLVLCTYVYYIFTRVGELLHRCVWSL